MHTLLLLALLNQADFKVFFLEGKQLFNSGEYQSALEKFKEAYRLNAKPQRIKTEGTYFDEYMPRYWIALCYEKLDVLEAEKWFEQSAEAMEEEIARKREQRASYNSDRERIRDAAAKLKSRREREYEDEMNRARDLIGQDRYAEAELVLQNLGNRFPARSEARATLETLPELKRKTLDHQFTEFQLSLAQKNFQKAEQILAQMRAIEAQFQGVSSGEKLLADAKADSALQASASPVVREGRPTPTAGSPAEKDSLTTGETPRSLEGQVQANQTQAQPEKVNERKQQARLRTALLDALSSYRSGYPEQALLALQRVDIPGREESPSYLWLNALFRYQMAATCTPGDGQSAALQEEGDAWLRRLLVRLPQFEPDPSTVPDVVLTACVRLRAAP
jgi:hypothetical protein